MNMKWLSLVVMCGLVVGLVGCGQSSTTVQGSGDKKLTLSAPKSVTVETGGKAELKLTVKREKFDDPVTIEITDLPKGVTVQETDLKFDKGTTEKTFTLKAADDAAGEEGHKARVSASGGGMKAGPEEVTVNVKKK